MKDRTEKIRDTIVRHYRATLYAGTERAYDSYNRMLKKYKEELNAKSLRGLEDWALGYEDELELKEG